MGRPRSSPETPASGVPIKISAPTAEAVRLFSKLYDESQPKFIDRCLVFFVENNQEEINARAQAFVEEIGRHVEHFVTTTPVQE